MSADGWREDLESPDLCKHCKLELPKARENVRRIDGDDYCVMCFDMVDAISENDYMKKAQQEYRLEQQALKKLKPGEDYLK